MRLISFVLTLILVAPAASHDSARTASDSAVQVFHRDSSGRGAGSGTVVACENGRSLVLTNWHVCPRPETFPRIFFCSVKHQGKVYPARHLGCDTRADLCALMVEAELPVAPMAKIEPPGGQTVEYWGHPKGGPQVHKTATTEGYLSRDSRFDAKVYHLHGTSMSGESGSGIFVGGANGKLSAVLWGGKVRRDLFTGEVIEFLPDTSCVGMTDIRRFLRTKTDMFPKLARELTVHADSNDGYAEGLEDARKSGLPLVTYVEREGHPVAGCEVCSTKYGEQLPGFEPGSVVVSVWAGEKHVGGPFDGDPTDPAQVKKFVDLLRETAR